jgi:nicotinamide-nucleotide adenylyltransferase
MSDSVENKDEEGRPKWLGRIIGRASLNGPGGLQWIRRAPRGISEPEKHLGVFPSSFNPPTTAHSNLIEQARRMEPLDEILLLLDRKSMDKEVFGASLEERLSMILLWCESDATLSLALTNRSRFVDKLPLLRKAYPRKTEIRFLVGYDTLLRILDVRYYENRETSLRRLFSGSQFLVANRGRAGIAEIRELMHQERNRPFSKQVTPFEIPSSARHLSSTKIRLAINHGHEIEDMVSPEIAAFIRRKGLYRNRDAG